MIRLFTWLSAIVVTMLLIVGLGIYGFTKSEMSQAKKDSAEASAKIAALSIAAQINMLNNLLDKMAQDPEVIAAVAINNPAMLNSVAVKLEKYTPDIMKIRLLPPGVKTPDENTHPHMGFADLDMVRETFTSPQPPGIQGDKGADRHLAIARQIIQKNEVVGVILASFKEEIMLRSFQNAIDTDTRIELKQGKLAIASSGAKGDPDNAVGQVNVPGTSWQVFYQYEGGADLSDFVIIACIILLPLMIVLLAFFVVHRKLSEILTEDLRSLMKAFKDSMTHSMKGNYPVKLAEMNAMISTLIQFKRVIDSSDKDTKSGKDVNIIVSDDEDFDLSTLFADHPDFKL